MYLRAKTYKNKDGSERRYLFLVATKRTGGRVRQVTGADLGRQDPGRPQETEGRRAGYSGKLLYTEDGTPGRCSPCLQSSGPRNTAQDPERSAWRRENRGTTAPGVLVSIDFCFSN